MEKFPSGIPAFGAYVRSLGMRFGIWVEPERVDLRQPATWQLDWLVRHHDAIVSPPWPPDTVSGWLCFGHPAVQAWAIDWISGLVTDVNADWLKWDSNWWGVCTCANHGHSVTDGEFHQVQGVHKVLAELRRRFPNLMIENCAGGGTRTDFAMLANTHITWLHDASTPSRRVRFHLAGANYLFPPELSNTWIVDADDESLADPAPHAPTSTPSPAAACLALSAFPPAWGSGPTLPLPRCRRPSSSTSNCARCSSVAGSIICCPRPTFSAPTWRCMANGRRTPSSTKRRQRALSGSSAGRMANQAVACSCAAGAQNTATNSSIQTPRRLFALQGTHLMAEGFTVDLSGRTSALLLLRA